MRRIPTRIHRIAPTVRPRPWAPDEQIADDLAAVILTASARLLDNPTLMERVQLGSFSQYGGTFHGFTLPSLRCSTSTEGKQLEGVRKGRGAVSKIRITLTLPECVQVVGGALRSKSAKSPRRGHKGWETTSTVGYANPQVGVAFQIIAAGHEIGVKPFPKPGVAGSNPAQGTARPTFAVLFEPGSSHWTLEPGSSERQPPSISSSRKAGHGHSGG
jgi:hypothetical protein